MTAAGLFVIGATHHSAPLSVREKLTLSANAADELRARFATMDGLKEFALLSTCNRVEFYGVAATPDITARITSVFCASRQFDELEFEKIRLDLRGRDVVQHLVEVSAGLDSQMLGETEIFGQVKEAYAVAQSSGTTGPVLNRVFQKGFQAAKHVRTHTAITEGQVSVANVAVDLALTIFGGLSNTRILLLGAGKSERRRLARFRVAVRLRSQSRAGDSSGRWSSRLDWAPARCLSNNETRGSRNSMLWSARRLRRVSSSAW